MCGVWEDLRRAFILCWNVFRRIDFDSRATPQMENEVGADGYLCFERCLFCAPVCCVCVGRFDVDRAVVVCRVCGVVFVVL